MKICLGSGYTRPALLLLTSVLLSCGYPTVVKALESNPRQLVEQGKTYYEAGAFSKAIHSLEEAVSLWQVESDWEPLAITLTNLGRVQLAAGQGDQAVQSWERAIALYRQHLPDNTAIPRLQVYRAQAFQELGLYSRACESLTEALSVSRQLCGERAVQGEDLAASARNALEISAWQALADVFRQTGRLEESQQILSFLQKQSLSAEQKAAIALNQGNTYQALGNRSRDRAAPIQFNALPWRCQPTAIPNYAQAEYDQAFTQYDQAFTQYEQASQSSSATIRTKAQLNRLNLLAKTGNTLQDNPTASILEELDLATLPFGQTRIYARILAAKTQACLSQNQEQTPNWSSLEAEIRRAIANAQQLNDVRAEAYAVGNLGSLYEYQAWWLSQNGSAEKAGQLQRNALESSDRALFLAQSVQAEDSAYQWYWQRGRLLKALGETTEAITAYEEAVKTLEKVREDLVSIDADVQFSFRDQVEPVYRELIGLLLDSIEPKTSPAKVQETLTRSLYYVESLQRVELENFLQCNLETIAGATVTGVANQSNPGEALRDRITELFERDSQAAFIYPILLEDRIAVILKPPGQGFRYHVTPLDSDDVDTVSTRLQTYLIGRFPIEAPVQKLSNQLYQWLIEPFEEELETAQVREESQVKRLTFVLDGALRNIPMAVLYDAKREQYLIERYAIAIAPSLQLLDARPTSRERTALVTGLSEEREFRGESFSSLPNVPKELDAIASLLPSQKLLNDEFILSQVQNQLQRRPYSIFHVATHGNFSSDPEDTYILLYDEQLQAREMNQLLSFQEEGESVPLELLVLSACETATGDRRAALGLAGIALRANTKSTLATLWPVDDESTAALMLEFYQELSKNPNLPKVEALRRAQLRLWENSDRAWKLPFFWAPYVLVGNWL